MINVIEGENLSGRSSYMISSAFDDGVYISPQINESLSGLSSNVIQEIFLNSKRDDLLVDFLVSELTLNSNVMSKSTHLLSGGEKAKVAIVCAIALNKKSIYLDCTLEQIEIQSRHKIVQVLDKYFERVYLSDNCFDLHKLIGAFDCIRPAMKKCKEQLRIGRVSSNEVSFDDENSKCMITISSLNYSYPNSHAVFDDFSCELEMGRIYQLCGKNGAGKSTLAKLLTGLVELSIPAIKINGELVDLYSEPGRYVSYHFQDPDAQLFFDKVCDQVSSDSQGVSSVMLEKAFGLSSIINESPFDLPLSVRKRVALASTISLNRPWYIFDEPTLFQDLESIIEIAKIIKLLSASGKGVIVISHSAILSELLKPNIILIEKEVDESFKQRVPEQGGKKEV